MIASGTPREVAIQEQFRGKMSATADRSGAIETGVVTPQDAAKKRLQKVRQAGQRLKSNVKVAALNARERGGEIVRKAKTDVQVAAANARERMKDRAAKPAEPADEDENSVSAYKEIDKDEGDASAAKKLAGNVLKFGFKRVTGKKTKKDPINYKKLAKELNNEEFIQEVEDKKDSKAKKVIDIMKGKNSIKINPDVKENTVVVQDASGKDFVEIVDIITPQKVRSDWRKEINVSEASAAWTRKEGKKKSGGLNEKGRKSYERQNPGSDLKAPSKKVGNPRRKSFCARMRGMKKKLTSAKTARDPDSRINKSLRAWNC